MNTNNTPNNADNRVVALDLEGTLISNAISIIPRPGLHRLLDRLAELDVRLVMMTTVPEPRFRDIATLLVEEGATPAWFQTMEYVDWSGATKDLTFTGAPDISACLLLDDYAGYVHPGQEQQWLEVKCFEHPYQDTDTVLDDTFSAVAAWCSKAQAGSHSA